MCTSNMPRCARKGRAALISFAVIAVLAMLQTATRAQVTATAYPTSYLNVSTGWNGAYPLNSGWGSLFTYQGSSGTGSALLDPFSRILSTRQDVNVLHGGYTNLSPTTGVTNSGVLEFTTGPATTPYYIDGVLPLEVDLGRGATASANISLSLAQVGGPTLASYLYNATYTLPVGVIAFDAASPTSGARSGSLLASTTYQLSWSWQVSMTHNGDPASNIDVAPGNPAFFQLFVPEPASCSGILFAASVLLSRRRRCAC